MYRNMEQWLQIQHPLTRDVEVDAVETVTVNVSNAAGATVIERGENCHRSDVHLLRLPLAGIVPNRL